MFEYYYTSPIGLLRIMADDTAIVHVDFAHQAERNHENKWTKECCRQLDEYFVGKRKIFALPLCPEGTRFQKKVWQALTSIPYGETVSYKHIATLCGNSKASRAVGMANNRNPICILIPCHRVIGANGNLVGYGGGLDKKEYLLALEKKHKRT